MDAEICNLIGEPTRISENIDKSLSVDVNSDEQGKKLKAMNVLVSELVQVVTHQRYYESLGVITCELLRRYTEEDIVEGLSRWGVVAVRRMVRKTNSGNPEPTSTLIVTFNKRDLPDRLRIRAGEFIKVRPYIPLPLRCYKCQNDGHLTKRCRSKQTMCGRCGLDCNEKGSNGEEMEHDLKKCRRTPVCYHCGSAHTTASKECDKYLMENEILAIKTTERVSLADAVRKMSTVFIRPEATFAAAFRSRTVRTEFVREPERESTESGSQGTEPGPTEQSAMELADSNEIIRLPESDTRDEQNRAVTPQINKSLLQTTSTIYESPKGQRGSKRQMSSSPASSPNIGFKNLKRLLFLQHLVKEEGR